MKKIIYIPIIALMLVFAGCENVLDREEIFKVSSESYYSNPEEIESALTASYSCLTRHGLSHCGLIDNLLADESFGGGGAGDYGFQDADVFESRLSSAYEGVWESLYQGILRANLVLENIDDVEYPNEDDKNMAKGEALFLRAYFHFRLTQYFGRITLKDNSTPGEDSQAEFDDIYNLIGSDLKKAIEIIPAKPLAEISKADRGHASKWAVQAYMARVWLYYTGYHKKSELTLADGTSITKNMVIDWLDDCIENSGHYLYDDFRELWPISSLAADTVNGPLVYPYAVNNSLEWVGDANDESVFIIKYSSIYANFGAMEQYTNALALHMGVRKQTNDNVYPFRIGWGACTGNPQFFESYDDKDVRKKATYLDVTDPEEGSISENFIPGDQWDYTGLYNKKYVSLSYNDPTNPNKTLAMYYAIWGGNPNHMMAQQQDWVVIRFSDVLLMAAELKQDVGLINQVRKRAKVDPIAAYSFEALQNERKWELAYECIRYWDLQRWGIAETEFAKIKDIPVMNDGVPTTYSGKYRPETKGLLPIPQSQIAISNGTLVQNEGW